MKLRLTASVLAAGAMIASVSGCGLVAPQGTMDPYAPSDGVDVSVAGIDIRNILLVSDDTGGVQNIVFSAVNQTGEDQALAVSFVGEDDEVQQAVFEIPMGSSKFGEEVDGELPEFVMVGGAVPGSTVDAYFQVMGANEVEHQVPVLDGGLVEYEPYVIDLEEAIEVVAAEEAEVQRVFEEAAEAQEEAEAQTSEDDTSSE